MRALQADAIGLTSADSVLVAVPMFHSNGDALQGSGRAPVGLDLKLVDEGGRTLPEQRNIIGRLPEIALVAVRLRADYADAGGDRT
jgi:hypothetical protein